MKRWHTALRSLISLLCELGAMKAHILIIESQINLAQFLALELRGEGYQVSLKHDGLSGLEAIQQLQPDLVILDWSLPRLAGIEICRYLQGVDSSIPIILTSKRDEGNDRLACSQAGVKDYLVKPFSLDDLLPRIQKHLEQNRYVSP
jgi:DNA-binding response OmpR family regulator